MKVNSKNIYIYVTNINKFGQKHNDKNRLYGNYERQPQ